MCEQCRSGEDPIHWPRHINAARHVEPTTEQRPAVPAEPGPLTKLTVRLTVALILLACLACAGGVAWRAVQWAWPG